MLSPRTKTTPKRRRDSPSFSSSASLITKFICISKLCKTPLNSFPPLRLIRTCEFKAWPNASRGLDVLLLFF